MSTPLSTFILELISKPMKTVVINEEKNKTVIIYTSFEKKLKEFILEKLAPDKSAALCDVKMDDHHGFQNFGTGSDYLYRFWVINGNSYVQIRANPQSQNFSTNNTKLLTTHQIASTLDMQLRYARKADKEILKKIPWFHYDEDTKDTVFTSHFSYIHHVLYRENGETFFLNRQYFYNYVDLFDDKLMEFLIRVKDKNPSHVYLFCWKLFREMMFGVNFAHFNNVAISNLQLHKNFMISMERLESHHEIDVMLINFWSSQRIDAIDKARETLLCKDFNDSVNYIRVLFETITQKCDLAQNKKTEEFIAKIEDGTLVGRNLQAFLETEVGIEARQLNIEALQAKLKK